MVQQCCRRETGGDHEMMESSVPVAQLAVLLNRWARESQSDSAREAASLLDALPVSTDIAVADADLRSLRVVYQRRVARGDATNTTTGAAELLEALDLPPTTVLKAAAVSVSGRVVAVWLDSGLQRVIGCVVGPDHRELPG